MKTPREYDPYGMMMELFLMEAAELQADEILLVSRDGHSNMYFVSGNRVRRLVKFRSDFATELATHIARASEPVTQTARTVPIRFLKNDLTEYLTAESRRPGADVNSTMPMPALRIPHRQAS